MKNGIVGTVLFIICSAYFIEAVILLFLNKFYFNILKKPF